MRISIIAAMGRNRSIGKDNDLIWNLPDDMRFFKEKTLGHVVIMGRKNYESIPEKWRPLPKRTNIILTTSDQLKYDDGALVMNKFEDALNYAKEAGEKEVFIIGGGQIYQLAINKIDRIYLTEINAAFEADVFFPEIRKEDWTEIERIHHPKDEKHLYEFDFVTYDRKSVVN